MVAWLWFYLIDLAYTNRMPFTSCQFSFGSIFMTVWKSANLAPGQNLPRLFLLRTLSVGHALWSFYPFDFDKICCALYIHQYAWTVFMFFSSSIFWQNTRFSNLNDLNEYRHFQLRTIYNRSINQIWIKFDMRLTYTNMHGCFLCFFLFLIFATKYSFFELSAIDEYRHLLLSSTHPTHQYAWIFFFHFHFLGTKHAV